LRFRGSELFLNLLIIQSMYNPLFQFICFTLLIVPF
jgi:hypothetical protein